MPWRMASLRARRGRRGMMPGEWRPEMGRPAKPKPWASKPVGRKPPKKYVPTNAKPVEEPEPEPPNEDTKERLIAAMDAILVEVDAVIPTLERFISWSYPGGRLGELDREARGLFERYAALTKEDAEPLHYWDCAEVFARALAAPDGAVPSFAREGRWIEWIGYVPVLCVWGGFLRRSAELRIVDPAEKWITSTGYTSLQASIPQGAADPGEVMRVLLEGVAAHKDFNLHDVSRDARDEAAGRLAEHPWLQRALEAGPIDAIRFPRRLAHVQQTLFD